MDNRNVAAKVLQTALDVVMVQRKDAHGDAEDSFNKIGEFWTLYIHAKGGGPITAYDVAQMMVLLKVVRGTMGNKTHMDHYVDTAGYAALAAMLAGVKTDQEKHND